MTVSASPINANSEGHPAEARRTARCERRDAPERRGVNRGYFGIGIVGGKTPSNVGTLWRSAGILGAAFIFTAGARYSEQASDTIKTWRHTPFHELDGPADAIDLIPFGCVAIAVETGGRDRISYTHPERAIYFLGAEDTGIPDEVLRRCRDTVTIPGDSCLNVAVAGSIVMYDRLTKDAAHGVRHLRDPSVARAPK